MVGILGHRYNDRKRPARSVHVHARDWFAGSLGKYFNAMLERATRQHSSENAARGIRSVDVVALALSVRQIDTGN